MYAVWVSDGSVSFKGCTFTGWRAIKLYEGSDNSYTTLQDFYDVEKVYIEDCVFEDLRKKRYERIVDKLKNGYTSTVKIETIYAYTFSLLIIKNI